MTPDIKRQTELYMVEKLSAQISDHAFLPFTGGSQTTGATEVEPPFTVIAIPTAQRTMATEGTWLCQGTAQIVTHTSESTSEAQAELVRKVYAALSAIPTQGDATFSFHGIDITDMTYATDEDKQFYADIINFVVGVGG